MQKLRAFVHENFPKTLFKINKTEKEATFLLKYKMQPSIFGR